MTPVTEEEQNRFLAICAANPAVQARFERLCERVQNDARTLHSAEVNVSDILSLREVILSAMGTGAPDENDLARELSELEPVLRAKRQAALKAGLPVHAADLNEVNMIQSRQRRLSEARRLGLTEAPPAPDQSKLSDAEKVRLCLSVAGPSERLALGRRLGLKF